MKKSIKKKCNKHITLIEGENIISDDIKVAKTMNTFFAKSILNLNMGIRD